MKDVFQREMRGLEVIREFPWGNGRAYARFLAQTYYYVCHSTRLLAIAASRIGVDREKLHHRFLRHAAEERSHHLLAQQDLAKLGFSLSDLPELPTTAALYETQYYRVEHVSPTSIFGYIIALEGLSVMHGRYVHEAVTKLHGEASSFVRLHSEEDPEHLEAAFNAVSTLSDGEAKSIEQNLVFSCHLYRLFLRGILEA